MATFRSQGKKKGLFRIHKTSLFIPSPIRYNDSIPTKRERLMDHVSQQTDTELLLQWYDARRRILPWREDPTPYHVWISEIMLQQTRVDAVIPYYERFLAALPDVKALAEADEEVCLKLWEGLGYYSRVRNMHKAARQIMEEYDGQIPATSAQLQKLAGIGRYTSEAIASIAFGEAVPSVDGNLLRVFARRTEYEGNIKSPQALRDAEAFYSERISQGRPGDYNQAVMDLGATICLPNGEPLCEECPWNRLCQAHSAGTELCYPVVPPKKARAVSQHTAILLRYGDLVLLEQRPEDGLLSGLPGFPMLDGHRSEAELASVISSAGSGLQVRQRKPYRHIFSHREWEMQVMEILCSSRKEFDAATEILFPRIRTMTADASEIFNRYSIPTAFRPCVQYLQK